MPREIQLIGQAYADESLTFSAQDTVNWIPVPDESGMARSPLQLRGLPGFSSLAIDVSDLFVQGVLPVATKGSAYTFTFLVSGGTAPYTYIYAGLPAGITASGATISGTPTSAGRYTITVTVHDDDGGEVSTTVSLFIADATGTVPDSGTPPPDGSGGAAPSTKAATIPNYNFEQGNTNWTALPISPSVTPGYQILNQPGYGGSSWVCRWTGTSAEFNYFENSKAIWKSGNYQPTIYIRCTSIDPATTATAGFVVRVYDDALKTTLLGVYDGGAAIFTSASSTWVSLTQFLSVGPYVSIALCAKSVGGTAVIEFDEVSFGGQEYITGYNNYPLTNGDFESGNTGWTVLNTGANDSFSILNDGSTWLLRWTCTSQTVGDTSNIANNASFLNAISARVDGSVRFRCTSITSGIGKEAYAACSIRAYNDPQLTDLFSGGLQVSFRPQGTTGWNTISTNSTEGKYLQFVINVGSNTPCVLEFDLATWNAREVLPL